MTAVSENLQARAAELRRQIDHHNHRYYVLDDPEVPDGEYLQGDTNSPRTTTAIGTLASRQPDDIRDALRDPDCDHLNPSRSARCADRSRCRTHAPGGRAAPIRRQTKAMPEPPDPPLSRRPQAATNGSAGSWERGRPAPDAAITPRASQMCSREGDARACRGRSRAAGAAGCTPHLTPGDHSCGFSGSGSGRTAHSSPGSSSVRPRRSTPAGDGTRRARRNPGIPYPHRAPPASSRQ